MPAIGPGAGLRGRAVRPGIPAGVGKLTTHKGSVRLSNAIFGSLTAAFPASCSSGASLRSGCKPLGRNIQLLNGIAESCRRGRSGHGKATLVHPIIEVLSARSIIRICLSIRVRHSGKTGFGITISCLYATPPTRSCSRLNTRPSIIDVQIIFGSPICAARSVTGLTIGYGYDRALSE